jgi:hypothetical protein
MSAAENGPGFSARDPWRWSWKSETHEDGGEE